MKCADIPDADLLDFLATHVGEFVPSISDFRPALYSACPPETPVKVFLAKLRKLIGRRLVDGCPCGCSTPLHITAKGLALLATYHSTPSDTPPAGELRPQAPTQTGPKSRNEASPP